MTTKPFKVYIAGKITGNEFYKLQFVKLAQWLKAVYPNLIVINPAVLPQGMSNADYARICLSMIDSADFVVFQSNMGDSDGCQLECDYCDYVGKPYAILYEKLDEENYCPECNKEVSIGYVCGEHFLNYADSNCPCCGTFKIMRAHNVDELNCWEVYKAMWKAEKAKLFAGSTDCEWFDDWMNHPFYKCGNCGHVFGGNVNYCENCGKRITGERGESSGNMAE